MRKYKIRPAGIMGSSAIMSELGLPSQFALFDLTASEGTRNLQNYKKTYRKRPGYDDLETLAIGTADAITGIGRFYTSAADVKNFFFKAYTNTGDSSTDLVLYDSVESIFATDKYAYAATIEGVVGDKVYGDVGVTTFQTDAEIAVGDYFVLDTDDDPNLGIAQEWAEVESIDSETQITLTASYTGTTSAAANTWNDSEKDATFRRPFNTQSIPDWCVFNNKLIFTFSDESVWSWTGLADAVAIEVDSTNATGFKYCVPFINRVFLANDVEGSGPMVVKWCKNGDETDWTDSTAGEADLIDKGSEIRGLSVVGNDLVVYTERSIIWGNGTGIAESPISFNDIRWGLGLHAPRSLISVRGQDYFLGYDNFYRMDGRTPIPIGDPVITELLDTITSANLATTIAGHFETRNEIWWSLGGTGKHIIAYDYQDNTWNYYTPYLNMEALGEFTISSENFIIGGSADTIYKFDKSYLSDNSQIITGTYVSPVIDFSDQDEEAFNKFKTIYGMRVLYKNMTVTDTPAGDATFRLYVRTDNNDWPGAVTSQVVLTTTNARTGVIEFDFIKTGNHFQFKFGEASTDNDWEIVGIEIDYDIRGDFFGI